MSKPNGSTEKPKGRIVQDPELLAMIKRALLLAATSKKSRESVAAAEALLDESDLETKEKLP